MTIKIIVIDDEVFVRKGIISSIEWEKYGIEVVGEASNGIEGLALIRETMPHIILTDIKMPHMDGLELIYEVRKEWPDMKILILTVMDDFVTVREALRLGVDDYVQKLIMTPDELLPILLRVKDELETQKNAAPASEQAEVRKRKESAELWSWIQGLQSVPRYEDVILSSAACLLVKIRIHDPVWRNALSCSAVAGRLRKGLKQEDASWISTVHISRESVEHYWLFVGMAEKLGSDRMMAVFQSLSHQDQLGRMSFGLSLPFSAGDQLQRAREQAGEALEQRFSREKEHVFIYKELRSPVQAAQADVFLPPHLVKSYLSRMEQEEEEHSMAVLDQLFPASLEEHLTAKAVKAGVMQWVSSVMFHVRDRGGQLEVAFPEESPFEQIQKLETYGNLREWCRRLHAVARSMLLSLRSEHRLEIRKAIDYIQSRYTENIRVKEIARWVHVSENYFSYLFTKETGRTFSQYLQELRIEKAKEMLEKGDLDWAQAGEEVGFESPKYFTKVFKRYYGVTPAKFARRT